MDVSVIDGSKVNTNNGLKIGSDTAPTKVVEFINIRCPYCKQWFEESEEQLSTAVEEGKIQRIIKLLDKDKESLQRGNVMHHYINIDQPEEGLAEIKKIFAAQDHWGNLSLEGVAKFAEETLSLTNHEKPKVSKEIIDEANSANIKFVPSIFIGDHIFDESINRETLASYIDGK